MIENRISFDPAYRGVEEPFGSFLPVFQKLDALLKTSENSKGPLIAAVEGNSGAGKSTLAGLLSRIYDCSVFHMDDFFLTPELRSEERLREPGGNVDYVRFKEEVLVPLKNGDTVFYRRYDCSLQEILPPVKVEPKKLAIIEGVYSMHPFFEDPYDLKIVLRNGEEEQKRRILERSGPVLYKRFVEEWIPMENLYFETYQIKGDLTLEV